MGLTKRQNQIIERTKQFLVETDDPEFTIEFLRVITDQEEVCLALKEVLDFIRVKAGLPEGHGAIHVLAEFVKYLDGYILDKKADYMLNHDFNSYLENLLQKTGKHSHEED